MRSLSRRVRLDPVRSPNHCAPRRKGRERRRSKDFGVGDLEAAGVKTARPAGDVEALVRLAAPDMAAVNALIGRRMQSDVPVIPALADHLIAAGGKRLRPLLTLAAARALNGGGEKAHKLAAAVEFIHTATLLHDDVVDGSEMRRSKVAAHLIWGSPSSVLVGDFLFARAFELMVETDSLRALHILARASAVISEGEVLQLTRSRDLRLDQSVYLQIVQAKTAELFAAAAESGAVAAGATDAAVEALRSYGMNLGLAFQLVDDALDYASDAETLGKNAGDDFREGKVTLPLLLAIQRTRGKEDAFWDRAVGKVEQVDGDFRRARELIVGTGALQATMDLAGDYADAAKDALSILPAGEWRAALENLADFAVSRLA
ncbi:MAG: polyprenyl synthetase family protein [Caulobacteraceae bacterium]|nr:polyprenyl synthetase family protein [Caulobacteraceae bacterium]